MNLLVGSIFAKPLPSCDVGRRMNNAFAKVFEIKILLA
jgi:hypothetical protein